MILTPDNEYAAVLDACVLYPMPLCDTLLRLAEEPAFYRPIWSEEILCEVSRTLIGQGYSEEQAKRRLRAMKEAFPEAMVDIPREIISGVSASLPDKKDCHVLAAAILSHANTVVTQNTRDFPNDCRDKYGILCQNADDFLIHQYWLGPEQVLEKLDYQAAHRKKERAALLAARV